MDIYFHENNRLNSKTFVFIHGGGWRGGDKKDIESFMISMMEKFPEDSFVNINYTLVDQNNFAIPNQTDEIDVLLKFLNKNSQKFHLNKNYILIGNSAGGHLAMFYTYQYKNPNVKAAINIVGPIDLSDENFQKYPDYSFVENYLVNPKSIPQKMAKTKYASPISWMSKSQTPSISFYGNEDKVIPFSQKTKLDSTISNQKINSEAYEFFGGHEDWREDSQKAFIFEKIKAFLNNRTL